MKVFTLQLTEITFTEALLIALLGFCLVVVVLAVLALFVKLLSKITGSVFGAKEPEQKKSSPVPKKAAPATASASALPAPDFSQDGFVYLENVSEKDAAVIMAIVSDRTGIPLERLRFNSVKRLDKTELTGISDEEAACVMAITADKLKKPLSNLDFKSIKSSEE